MLILSPDDSKLVALKGVLGDLELIKDAIPLLSAKEQSALLLAMEEALEGDGWPIAYVNMDRYKVYQPHHGEELDALQKDTPRHLLVKGSEGCHSYRTSIKGIPIPEWAGGPLSTGMSSRSYLKGRADLYRVGQVEVTLDHRFLTPFGWRQLRDLDAGAIIAACDTEHDDYGLGIATGYQARCSVDFRPCDGLPAPQVVLARDMIYKSLALLCATRSAWDVLSAQMIHPYKRCSSSLWAQTPQHYESLLHAISTCVESYWEKGQSLWQYPHMFRRLDTVLQSRPLEDHIWLLSFLWEELLQTHSSEWLTHMPERYQALWQQLRYLCGSPIDGIHLGDPPFSSSFHDQCEHHFAEEPLRCDCASSQSTLPFSSVFQALRTSQQRSDHSFYHLLTNDNIYWTVCQDVSFVEHGDYYDLSVPMTECYPAQGLLHHNSGKSVFGIIKDLERIRRGMSGLMACVAPETMVGGVPIGDRHSAFTTPTLQGLSLSSPGFVEERADLFRVETSTGDRVLVTRSHRFLTPVGWRQLEHLRVGDLIAVDGNACDPYCSEIGQGSSVDYSLDFHQYDECAISLGQPFQDRSQRPALLIQLLSRYIDSLSHACTEDSFSPSYLVFLGALQSLVLAAADIASFAQCDTFVESVPLAYNSDNLESWRLHPDPPCGDNACSMPNDHWHAKSDLRLPYSYPSCLQSPEVNRRCQTTQLPVQSFSYSYPECTIKMRWAQIEEVTFSREGEAYGLIVPQTGYYIANGVISHNSPSLPHFQRSLWKEFQRWCPWDYVVPSHRRMAAKEWMPTKPFDVVFENGAYLHCLGAKVISSLEGPNISFAHFDEARLFEDAGAVKTIDGRIRIEGPNGEPPQAWYTTTPKMNWLYEFFGPIECKCPEHGKIRVAIQEGEILQCPVCHRKDLVITDKYAEFKFNSRVVSLHVRDNADNLSSGFVEERGRTLTENEKAVLIDALWIDSDSDERFLPNMLLWDACKKDLPKLTNREPMVVAMDASELHDSFALVGVTRDPFSPDDSVSVRYVENWDPGGRLLDYRGTEEYPGPELRLLWLADNYDVIEVVYDPYQLHDFAQRMIRDNGIWCERFSQGSLRLESDRQLLDMIFERRVTHDGNDLLREHIDNANRRRTATSGKSMRIVKRTSSMPVDCCVALSMAAYECMRLNL